LSIDKFWLGPRDYLHQFLTLLSVLRNGDHRFLPLLLAKVHDVLPTLVTPMLQTVPDTPASNMCAEVDIFGGYPAINLSPFQGVPSSSASDFKLASQQSDFKMESPGGLRLDEMSSPTEGESPFTSPPIIQSQMEYPLGEYGNFADLHGPHMAHHLPSSLGNFGEGVGGGRRQANFGEGVGGGRQVDFKREFEGSLGIGPLVPSSGGGAQRRPPPLRQTSSSGFGMHQIPRSVPHQDNGQFGGLEHPQLQTVNSNGSQGQGLEEIGFR